MPPDLITVKCSLAVQLTDSFTQSHRTQGELIVSIEDSNVRSVQNRSGYHVFLDLNDGDIVVQVRSPWYLDEDRDVHLPLNPLNPLLEMSLIPNWMYPFRQNATLIRGHVADEVSGLPVPGVLVELLPLTGKQVETRTSPDGRFVLYVTGLTEDDVQPGPNGNALLSSNGNTDFQLRLSRALYDTKVFNITNIIEGQTFLLTNPISLHKT